MIKNLTLVVALLAGSAAYADDKDFDCNGKSKKCESEDKSMNKDVEVPPFVIANFSDYEDEISVISYDSDGNPADSNFKDAEVSVRANADHKIVVTFDAIEIGGECKPIFLPEGEDATESDGIIGEVVVTNESEEVGEIECLGSGSIKEGSITFEKDLNSVKTEKYSLSIKGLSASGAVSNQNGNWTEVGAVGAGDYRLEILFSAALDTDVTYEQMEGV